MKNKRFRHENKYMITPMEKEALIKRFDMIMPRDAHAKDGGYFIRSLYFDNLRLGAYHDKMDGVNERQKYRIRIYDMSDQVIKLECKEKIDAYIYKRAASLTREEYDKILAEDVTFLLDRKEDVCHDFYHEIMLHGLKPMVLVDYDRQPFVYPYGDVRITFDSNLRAGISDDVFDASAPIAPVMQDELIMEVKYTEFLPDIIRGILPPADSIYTAYSKYTLCLDKKIELQNIQ